jgi:hypothetical protein
MQSGAWRSRALACVTMALVTQGIGCSWISVTTTPHGPIAPEPPVRCTTEVSSPVMDTIFAGLLVVGGVTAIVWSESARTSSPCTGWCTVQSNAGTIAGGVAILAATPLAFSAGDGYSSTAQCRRMREAQLSCMSGVEESCQTLRERE